MRCVGLWVSLLALSLPAMPVVDETGKGRFVGDPVEGHADHPIAYTMNEGQFPGDIAFVATVNGTTLLFRSNGVHQIFSQSRQAEPIATDVASAGEVHPENLEMSSRKQRDMLSCGTEFVGSSQSVAAVGLERLSHSSHYFLGNDPSKWRTGVPSFAAIKYPDLYSGIDLKYYSDLGRVKYDFIVRPEGDVSDIRIRYSGYDELKLTPEGHLWLRNAIGQVVEASPVVYQLIRGQRRAVESRYVLSGNGLVGFELGTYDPSYTVVIDPLLIYSNHLGGGNEDWGYAVTVDRSGVPYIFVTGHTWSPDYPTGGIYEPLQTDAGSFDVFLSVFDPVGNTLISSTYLGGDGDDWGFGIHVDSGTTQADLLLIDDVYLTGATSSSNFPLWTPADNTLGGESDAFVSKLRHVLVPPLLDSVALVYSTYLGGSRYDAGHDIVVNPTDHNAYVTGMTYSHDFPASGAASQPAHGGYWDGFIARMGVSGTLDGATYFGGSSLDAAYGIDWQNNEIYITGCTWSEDFPVTPGAVYGPLGGQEAFVAKLSENLTGTAYSALLGGSSDDYARDISVTNGSPVVAGWTESDDFPRVTPSDDVFAGSSEAFVTMFPQALTGTLIYSTYLGGSGTDHAYGVSTGPLGQAYVTGKTESLNFPTTGAGHIDNQDTTDAFFARLSVAGQVDYSTYFGGPGEDWGYGIAVWEPPPPLNEYANLVYITGKTSSDTLPPADYMWQEPAGEYDMFLAWYVSENISGNIELPTASIVSITPSSPGPGTPVTFVGSGDHAILNDLDTIVAYRWWSSIDGFLEDTSEFTYDALSVGTHTIYLAVQDTLYLWSPAATASLTVTDVLNRPTAVIDDISPNPVLVGEAVTFSGHGEDVGGGSISARKWVSDLDGELNTVADTFSTSALSAGSHRISYTVWDNENNASHATEANVVVLNPHEEYWEMSFWHYDYQGEFDLQMHDQYSCSLIVTNPMQHEQTFEFSISRATEFYTWGGAVVDTSPSATWSMDWVDSPTVNGSPYSWGDEISEPIGPGQTRRYVIKTGHDWQWISYPSLLTIISTALSFTPVSFAFGTAVELMADAKGIYDYYTAPMKVVFADSLLGDPAVLDTVRVDTVYVRAGKTTYYWDSMVLATLAARFSNLAWAFLAIPPPVGPVIPPAVICFVSEAILYGASYWTYFAAWDPNPNYTEHVHPTQPQLVSFYTYVQSLEESCWKRMAYDATELYTLDSAAYECFARCAGALQDEETEWAASQLAASLHFKEKAAKLVGELNALSRGLSGNLDTPNADEVNSIKQRISNEGLPSEEDSILTRMGFASDTAAIADEFYSHYDGEDWQSFAGSYSNMSELMSDFVTNTQAILDDLYRIGIDGAAVGRIVKVEPELVSGGPQTKTVNVWIKFPGLLTPLADLYDFVSLSATSDNTSPSENVSFVGFSDGDGDSAPELVLSFPAVLASLGHRLRLVHGYVVDTAGSHSWDTIPFAAATSVEVVGTGRDTVLTGCVYESGEYEGVSDVQVLLCTNSIGCDEVTALAGDTTGTDGTFLLNELLPGERYLSLSHLGSGGYTDTVYGPVQIAAHDTATVCLVLPALASGCCGKYDMEGRTGNVDYDPEGIKDLTDILALASYAFLGGEPPPCLAEMNVSGDPECVYDLSDILDLASYAFLGGTPPAYCMPECE